MNADNNSEFVVGSPYSTEETTTVFEKYVDGFNCRKVCLRDNCLY